MKTLNEIEREIRNKYNNKEFIIDKSGKKLIELLNVSFVVGEKDWLFKEPNHKYRKAELNWYLSKDLSILGIKKFYGKIPVIWKNIADYNNNINSNYGYLIFSEENGNQYQNCIISLLNNKYSRQAIMIYNRPEIHTDSIKLRCINQSDFICTMYNQFFIRDNKLISIYNMRSNDIIFGFANDSYWAKYVHKRVYKELKETAYSDLEIGDLIWNVSSFHIYENHFKYLNDDMTGK